jgi:hypothetical protein
MKDRRVGRLEASVPARHASRIDCMERAMSMQQDRAGGTPSPDKAPGDEVRPGTPQAGEAVCPLCAGSGHVQGKACGNCRGTGKITQLVGDA